MKQVTSVLGPVNYDNLGVTLMHEHLFTDIRCWWEQPRNEEEKEASDQPISLSNLGLFRREPFLSREALVMDSLDTAIHEVLFFKRAGGGTIVDVTPEGIGRNPLWLQKVARATKLNIVCGCGYYLASTHPATVAAKSKKRLAEELIGDLMEGIGETGVRAGIIGEIGLSPGIQPQEEKVLRAAALASKETGAAITVHPPWPKGQKLEILDILKQEGADLSRVIMGHLEYEMDLDLHIRMADRGVFLEYDCFGQEYYHDVYGCRDPLDEERVMFVTDLINRGYRDQILLSHDVATKLDLRSFGGWGYDHINRHIEPAFQRAGVTAQDIHVIRWENPWRALSF